MKELKTIAKSSGYNVVVFDTVLWGRAGFVDHETKTIFINAIADTVTVKKIIYHELGHKGHNPEHYDRLREKYELQANKAMLKKLLDDELNTMDIKDFNPVNFCQKYQLKESYYLDLLVDFIA